MELFQDLLNSHIHITSHNGFSVEANQTLIEQLLSNFAIERADIDSVLSAISGVTSERIKLSILNRLGDYCPNGRFTIQCDERNSACNVEDLIVNINLTLDYKYWHTLTNRLNISSYSPHWNRPNINSFLTLYPDEAPYEFNLENIKKLLKIFNEDLYKAEALKELRVTVFEKYEVVLETLKNDDVKLKINGSDPYDNLKSSLGDLLNGALYFNDTEWYLNSEGLPKNLPRDIKGVAWTSFKNSKHILTMNKSTAEIFKSFYGINN